MSEWRRIFAGGGNQILFSIGDGNWTPQLTIADATEVVIAIWDASKDPVCVHAARLRLSLERRQVLVRSAAAHVPERNELLLAVGHGGRRRLRRHRRRHLPWRP